LANSLDWKQWQLSPHSGLAAVHANSGLFVRLPLQNWIVGRTGPVSARDLWSVFFQYLPTWAVVLGVESLARLAMVRCGPFVQLLVCVPVGLLVAVVMIAAIPQQRRVALKMLEKMRGYLVALRPSKA
jgi:hypothetical protein